MKLLDQKEIDTIKNSCLDNIRYIRIKREKRMIISYSDMMLELMSLQTLLDLESLEND